jgi:glyoxylase-like metal-dependent hydrolase (beta-lactamase superfamily II)
MTTRARIQQFREDLFLISLPVAIEGFDDFIGAWVLAGNPMVVVDVGPSATVPHLLSALAELDAGRPGLLLLTHIHIDHAGGIGAVSAAFPQATVVCHPRAVEHLIDPERLWQGSLKTLGEIAKSYGPIPPLPAGRVLACDRLQDDTITCIETPGHAVHHVSFLLKDLLFAGEVAGVHLPMNTVETYLRPATPPRFMLETSIDSIDRVAALSPQHICYGHIGMRDNAVAMLNANRDQLLRWREMIRPFFDDAQGRSDLEAMQACRGSLIVNDPLLAGFHDLAPEVQQRERNFMLNAIKGFWGYFQETAASSPG